jgi:FkbM family methyltransferase
MEHVLQFARRFRTSVGGQGIWNLIRPSYWYVVGRLAGDAGLEMRLSDGNRYRLDATLFAWQVDHYEQALIDVLLAAVQEQSIVYDIGSHVGLIALMAAGKVRGGRGHVYAFEPSPDNFALLQRHIRINRCADRVTPVQTLVGDRCAAAVPFAYRAGQFTANSLAYEVEGSLHTTLPMTTIDGFVQATAAPPADVVKIDVEGYEHAVVKGMRSLLDSARPLVICAIHPEPLTRLGTSPDAVINEMAESGYRAYDLSGAEIRTAGFEEIVFRPA